MGIYVGKNEREATPITKLEVLGMSSLSCMSVHVGIDNTHVKLVLERPAQNA